MLYTNTYQLPNPFTGEPENFAQGEDYYVTGLQTAMYSALPAKLGLNPINWNCFGRCYRSAIMQGDKIDGYIPLAYNNGQYLAGNGGNVQSGIFPNNGLVISFFGESGQRRKESGYDVVPYELIFFIDTSVINIPGMSGATIRQDEVIISIIKNFVDLNGNGLRLRGVERDMDKVLERYSGITKRMNLVKNLQPFVCFKLNLELVYNSYLQLVKLVA